MCKKEMKAKSTVKKIGGSLFIQIPRVIVELMDIKEGDILNVPFLEFDKVEPVFKHVYETERDMLNIPSIAADKVESDKDINLYKLENNNEIVVDLINCGKKTITRDKIIEILQESAPDDEIHDYRSVYFLWNGKKYGVKNVLAKILGTKKFNTVQGENYLHKLGFMTGRKEY